MTGGVGEVGSEAAETFWSALTLLAMGLVVYGGVRLVWKAAR